MTIPGKGGAPKIFPQGKRKMMLDERLAKPFFRLAKKRKLAPTKLLDEVVFNYLAENADNITQAISLASR